MEEDDEIKKIDVKDRAYIPLAMDLLQSQNKTLNFLKSNLNELKLVQKVCFLSLIKCR